MTPPEGNRIHIHEARKAMLQQMLCSFQQEAIAAKNVVVDETQEASITFTRSLTPEQLPKTLKALLVVVGATSKDLKLQYKLTQSVSSQNPGRFLISWDSNADNDNRIYEAVDESDRAVLNRFESRKREIKSISFSTFDWRVSFVNEFGRSIEFDQYTQTKPRDPYIFASLKVVNDLFNNGDANLQFQEEIVSLLDINAESSNLEVTTKELDSLKKKREERVSDEKIRQDIAALMLVAKKILGS